MHLLTGTQGHTRAFSLLSAVPVFAGDTVEFVGVGEDCISWQGGKQPDGSIRLGLSYTNVGAAAKPGT
jgi:hypothetical protein